MAGDGVELGKAIGAGRERTAEPSLFRRAWQAIDALDAGALTELCHPEVMFESRITAVEQSVYHGHDGIRRFIANLRDAFDWIEVRPFDVVEAPDRAVITNRFRAHGRGSGVDVEQTYFVAMRAQAGRVLWWRLFDSRAEAMRAVEMTEAGLPADNTEAARRLLAAVAARDLAQLRELTAPELEWQSFFAIGQGGAYHGHDGLAQYVRDLDESFESLRPEASGVLAVGELVIVVGRIHYRGKGSGIEAEAPAGWVFRFSGGQLVRFRAFRDPEQALDAVGLEAC